MKTIVISNFYDIPNEHYLLDLLFCEGLEIFHLRKKNYTYDQMERYIERIPIPFRQFVVLHSHYGLIEKYQLKGAHFTKDCNLNDKLGLPMVCLEPDGPRPEGFAHVSFSLHTIQEIKKVNPSVDYIFLSPVFDSISNMGYNSKFRINDLKMLLNNDKNRPEVIALSGITDERVEKVHELGFDGLALLGFIWRIFQEDQNLIHAVERFKRVRNLAKKYEIPTANFNMNNY